MRRSLYLLGFVLLMSSSICFSPIACKSRGNPSSPNPFIATATFTITPTSTNSPCGFPSDTCTSTWTYTPTSTFTATITATPNPAYAWVNSTMHAAFPARADMGVVSYDNKMWVIGGIYMSSGSDVYSSVDGVNWSMATTTAAFGRRSSHGALVYQNKMWVLGGLTGPIQSTPEPYPTTNSVFSSSDGISWAQAPATVPFPARAWFASLVYNDRMWVIGGYDTASMNDVWSSTDGSTWTQATSNAAFSSRSGSGAVSFNGKMWLIGGRVNGSTYSDIYSSTDGANWNLENAHPPFGPRSDMGVYVLNGYIWLVGGYIGYYPPGSTNEVWYSPDGINWNLATSDAGFAHYELLFGYTVFDAGSGPKMWALGGTCIFCIAYNDVWHSP